VKTADNPGDPPLTDPLRAFGARIRELRRAHGWTEGRLAQECSLTPGTISRIERARQEPRLSTILVLSRVLDVSVHELVDLIAAPTGRSGGCRSTED
jgi:transcriptional regulator with XRE-family HTH domain